VQAFLSVVVVAALVLPFLLRDQGLTETKNDLRVTLLCLLLVSVLNVELGRLTEGGLSQGHRAHKLLSVWAFCSALLLPTPYLLLVVTFSYTHTWVRGVRLPLWKWIGSAAFVVLAGLAAGIVAHSIDPNPNFMNDNGGWGLLSALGAAVAFLAVETALFFAVAYLNDAEDEVWLRRTLASRSFYVTELSVLLMGALSAAVWTAGAWFLLLLIPVYAIAQRAVLSDNLRHRAETDDKTGLLRFESWRSMALVEQERCQERGRPWSVAFLDLDHFKAYNDRWGHLVGDTALAAIASVLRDGLRSRDLVGRFGGEEFCVFLPDTALGEATAISERLRLAVSDCVLPDSRAHSTTSVGVVTFLPSADKVQLGDALNAADQALFEAKASGRNRVCAREVAPTVGWLAATYGEGRQHLAG
jgi:diguanylate cyclase (GGDEF)-like protein